MCSDQDIISQSGGYLPNITGRKFKQVTVAETGVTGFNIRNVKIHSVCSQTSITATQQSTAVMMTVVDPLGTNFLDGLFAASSLVGIHDYTKCSYYLELSFTGYNEDGSYGGRPLKGMSNGGTWIYMLSLTNVSTSINEGGGVFDLEFVTDTTIPLLDIRTNNQNTLPQTLTVFGTTVKEIFSDYTRKYNKAIEDLYGIGIQKIKEIKTHPIAAGPSTALNKDPGNFKLKFQEPEKSYQRGMSFSSQNGQTSCQIPAGTTTADFIMSTIINTEEGQNLIRDVDTLSKRDISDEKPNSKGVRESVIFNVEPVFSKTGVETGVTNSYVTEITYHVTSHSTMLGITPASVVAAKSPDVQKTMYDTVINQGFFKKRYDYLYTGKNTEVISYDIKFNTEYMASLATRHGARLSMDNVATHALLNDVNKSASNLIEVKQNDAKPYISTLVPAQPLSISNNGLGGPVSSIPLINDIAKTIYSNNNSLTAIVKSQSGFITPTNVNASQQKISGTVTSNIYVEDFLDRKTPLPISFAQDIETSDRTGSGYTGAYDRDKSTVGAILSNIYGSPSNPVYTTAFQKIELTIRGDPYWLGQTNIERILLLQSGKSTNAAKADQADFLTAQPMLQMYFKYPIKMGDDFVPVLKDSEVFDGTYQINEVVNSFENGSFTQTLKGLLHPIMTIKAANAISGNTPSNSEQSSNGKATPASPSNVNGGLPTSGSLPTRLNDAVNASPTAIQKNDSTTIGSLTQQQTAQMKASLGASESDNNQYAPANSQGKIGQYQMGQSALQDAGYTTGAGGSKNPGTWGWTGKDGVYSYQDYLKNADAQNTSFNNFAISNRNILVNNGVINNNTTPEQEAGFILAAHLGGAKGTSDYFNRVQSNSSYIPTDSNGTSIVNYYQLGQQAVSKVK